MPYRWQLTCLVFCNIFRTLSEMCYIELTVACHTYFNLAVLESYIVCRITFEMFPVPWALCRKGDLT